MPLLPSTPLTTPLLGTAAAALALSLVPGAAVATSQDPPPADSPVAVEKTRVTKTQKVPAGVTKIATTELAPGKRKVVREGRPGVRRVVAVRTFHDGEPVKYRVVSRTLKREPRPRRVLVGREPYSVPGADGLNWRALAGCESGGNPRAVNSAGYYGLYQFSVSTWRSVGGSGMPHLASPDEQTYRAKRLYASQGRSPWPTCGRLL